MSSPRQVILHMALMLLCATLTLRRPQHSTRRLSALLMMTLPLNAALTLRRLQHSTRKLSARLRMLMLPK